MFGIEDDYIAPDKAVDAIEEFAGRYPGYRRAHPKGIAFDAKFEPNGNVASLTKAQHLQDGKVQAVVRFSHSTVTPDPPEWLVPIKGMAVQFSLPDGGVTNLTMANVPVFVTKTPEAFVRLLKMMTNGELSWREKWRVLRKDPEYRTVLVLLKQLKPTTSFAEETYHALHSYYLVNEQDKRQAVRFRWVPVLEENKGLLTGHMDDLETELIERMKSEDVQFRLMVLIAGEGDLVDDPSVRWPEERPMIEAGILTLKSVREDAAESLVFDPTMEVEGLECSDDPILRYRSPVYAESSGRRLREERLPK
ncbi:catalase [Sporosarcina highlanderae]|uniref:Catalase-related peroxidase n=1 Tax=Sporosarcina highlanderae TaxID=3035916 RepID=A0ABT8JP17_9BACL|nr:catalase [Sporosarcina highlanderae]MDN4606810.1 catalase [Sporosarcina highlanderae]